jgi:replication initiation protein RepC
MVATSKIADDFAGSPAGSEATRPGQVLAAFKGAAPYLGFSPRVVHAIDWLFTFTQPQDWLEGSRPIVWPSAALQREALGLEATQVKALNRHLVELGLVTMKDSPNGKRYGRRQGPRGAIVEAYGFDLSPLHGRMAEFHVVAEQGRALREEMRHLRRRATIARKGLMQILETAAEQGLTDPVWRTLDSEGRAIARSLKGVERVEEMAVGVASLERRQQEARKCLDNQLAAAVKAETKEAETDPKGPEYRPHYNNYNPNLNLEQDTVMASKESSQVVVTPEPAPEPTGQRHPSDKESPVRTDRGTVMRLNPQELIQLAPRLLPYLRTPSPAWPEIVEAADWLRHDLGVSQPLWGDACLVLGREQAAIAIAIVSAKPAEHFTASPASYFHGMVKRAKSGELNLSRTIWGLRDNSKTRSGAPSRRQSAGAERWNS